MSRLPAIPPGAVDWRSLRRTAATARLSGPTADSADAEVVLSPRPLAIVLRQGRYTLTRPLEFTPDNVMPMVIRACEGETAIIDGGRRIQGWVATEVNGMPAWMAPVPEVVTGAWNFKQLFVNGRRAQRPVWPENGLLQVEDPLTAERGRDKPGANAFKAAEGDFRMFHNMNDLEVVALHYGFEERLPVLAFDPFSRTVTVSRTSRALLVDGPKGETGCAYYIENVFETFNQPGQFYVDRSVGLVYYLPRDGEVLSEIEAYAPVLSQWLRLIGRPHQNQFVEWVRFENIVFEHTSCLGPGDIGFHAREAVTEAFTERTYTGAGADDAASDIPAAIHLEGVRHCSFEGCVFRHVGWYAVEVGDGCSRILLDRNTVNDGAAGGFKIGGVDAMGRYYLRTGNVRVSGNHIHDLGLYYLSATGILVRHAFGNQIVGNHLHDMNATAVSLGWVRSYGESLAYGNLVADNHIHHAGQAHLKRAAGIVTYGRQPGAKIHGNVIHHIATQGDGWAILAGEGSSQLVIENNLGYRTGAAVFGLRWGCENIVRNNLFALGRTCCVALDRVENHNPLTLTHNILLTAGTPVYQAPADLRDQPFIAMLNLFWDLENGSDVLVCMAGRNRLDLPAWQALRCDIHTRIADPGCTDPLRDDFTLGPDSPAVEQGFTRFPDNKVP